jgi:hypothetical protein
VIRRGFAMTWDMSIRPIESGPLTSREIEELDAFLHAEDGLENPMDFYTFDGFICAVLSAPNTIMPSEWLRWVCAVTRRRSPVGASPTRQPLQPEATGAVMEVTKWLKPSDSGSRIGDRASVQAAT